MKLIKIFFVVLYISMTGPVQGASALWKSCLPRRSRDILFLSPCYPSNNAQANSFNCSIFANRQTRMGFPARDYLNNTPLQQTLDLSLRPNCPATLERSVMINKLMGMLNQISFQEHKIGAVLSTSIDATPWLSLDAQLPIYVSYRNFWINLEMLKEIRTLFSKKSSNQQASPTPTAKSSPSFGSSLKKQALHISSKGGISDARLALTFRKKYANKLLLRGGPELIVPLGRLFMPQAPLLNDYKILTSELNITTADDLIHEVRQLGLRPNLGNEGHWGIGGFIGLHTPLPRAPFEFWTNARYTYFAPTASYRFIPIKNNNGAEFSVRSTPGNILQWTSALEWKIKSKIGVLVHYI